MFSLLPSVHFCCLLYTSVAFCTLRAAFCTLQGNNARFELSPEHPLTGVSDVNGSQDRWNLTIFRCTELADCWKLHFSGTTACEFRVFDGIFHFTSSLHRFQSLPRGFNSTVDGFLCCSSHVLTMFVFGGISKATGIANSRIWRYQYRSVQKCALPSKKLPRNPFAHKIWHTLSP